VTRLVAPKWFRKLLTPLRLVLSRDTPGTIGKRTLLKLLRRDPLIIEIGAHIGTDSYDLSRAFPKGKVIGFEPSPGLLAKALAYNASRPNIFLIPCALSEKPGFRILHQSSGTSDGSSSILAPTNALHLYPGIKWNTKDQIVVPALTLDDFVDVAGIDQIDLIWIDAQGAEGLIFRGAHNALRRTRFVYCEVCSVPEYAGAATYSEICTLLSEYQLIPMREYLPAHWNGSGNVLFGRK
jgi:FkbM family methyltransferase